MYPYLGVSINGKPFLNMHCRRGLVDVCFVFVLWHGKSVSQLTLYQEELYNLHSRTTVMELESGHG